jgi:hypothetical protein
METLVKKKLAILSAVILSMWTTLLELFFTYPGSVCEIAFYLVTCILFRSGIVPVFTTKVIERVSIEPQGVSMASNFQWRLS